MLLRNSVRAARRSAGRMLVSRTVGNSMIARVGMRHFCNNFALQQENKADEGWKHIGQIKPKEKPRYQLSFTCKKCSTRSTHEISKQAYHKGTVLIQCPGCKNRHLIADHLKIFSDTSITLEDILARTGETMEKRAIGPDEVDLEWEPAEEYTDPKQ